MNRELEIDLSINFATTIQPNTTINHHFRNNAPNDLRHYEQEQAVLPGAYVSYQRPVGIAPSMYDPSTASRRPPLSQQQPPQERPQERRLSQCNRMSSRSFDIWLQNQQQEQKNSSVVKKSFHLNINSIPPEHRILSFSSNFFVVDDFDHQENDAFKNNRAEDPTRSTYDINNTAAPPTTTKKKFLGRPNFGNIFKKPKSGGLNRNQTV